MDGVFEDSSWPLIIQLIDGADRVLHSSSWLLSTLCFISLYYIFMGNWLDLFLNGILLGLKYRHALTSSASYLWKTSYAILMPIAAAIVTSLLILSTLNKARGRCAGHGRPYLIPCRTTHTRLFPKKYSFGYSYLAVGVPVDGSGHFNGMLAIEQGQSGGLRGFLTKTIRGGWYTVDADDYLQRGHNDCGLRGKLDEYLRSQDVDPDDYPHAYLVTAPRFLGYQFNPVSFWYLYTSDKILSAMILEVNNTFDERRPYLVRSRLSTGPELLAGPTSDVSSSSRIKGLWLKDFHVSPFNSRKGTYSVLANDPLGPGMTGFQGVDVTINLSSSKGHPKLVARLFSQEQAIDPDSMSILAKIGFLSRWSWVGFATFPRIVKEAAALFFKRKLHVWYRPEPLRESLGRRATNTERDLEVAFRSYLRFLVGKCQKALSVAYVSSGIVSEVEETISSPSCGIQPGDIQKLGLKVLTPIFYSRFMHYAHDFEAIFTEFADSGTIWVDKPHLLTELFLKKGSPLIHTISTTDYFCFKSIQYLRRRPEQIPRVSTSADLPVSAPATVDIRDFRISPMDAYILEYADARLKKSYRSNLLRLFIADRYLMGYLGLLDGLLLVFQFGVARFLVTTLS